MPQILIVTDSNEGDGEVVYRETLSAAHLATGHAGAQLVERLAWAIGDARVAERRGAPTSSGGRHRPRSPTCGSHRRPIPSARSARPINRFPVKFDARTENRD